MENKEIVDGFEAKVRKELTEYLQSKKVLDDHVPECPDVEEKWAGIAREYLPDGAREFKDYPVVSLGWIMFVGMAMAFYWDKEWEKHADRTDYYTALRDLKGYDNMDEAIVEQVLGYSGETAGKITDLVAECASRVYSMLNREHIEPGTSTAVGCYLAAIHQLYLAGMAMELNSLGYHMTPLGSDLN